MQLMTSLPNLNKLQFRALVDVDGSVDVAEFLQPVKINAKADVQVIYRPTLTVWPRAPLLLQ